MKFVPVILGQLAWFAATAFVVWMLHAAGHPVWAGLVAVFGAAAGGYTLSSPRP